MIDAFCKDMTATTHYNDRKSTFKSAKIIVKKYKIFRPSTSTDILKMND